MEKIYVTAKGLGDVWAAVSWAIQESKRTGVPTILTDHYFRRKDGLVKNYREVLNKVLPLFPDIEKHVSITEQDGNTDLLWNIKYDHVYTPTILTWQPTKTNIVTYQFDGKSHPEKMMKPGEIDELYAFLKTNGFKPTRVGGRRPLEESVQLMARAQFHVGVDSGLIHVGRSVGIPTVLIRNDLWPEFLKIYNKHPKLTIVNDLKEFKIWVEKFKANQRL